MHVAYWLSHAGSQLLKFETFPLDFPPRVFISVYRMIEKMTIIFWVILTEFLGRRSIHHCDSNAILLILFVIIWMLMAFSCVPPHLLLKFCDNWRIKIRAKGYCFQYMAISGPFNQYFKTLWIRNSVTRINEPSLLIATPARILTNTVAFSIRGSYFNNLPDASLVEIICEIWLQTNNVLHKSSGIKIQSSTSKVSNYLRKLALQYELSCQPDDIVPEACFFEVYIPDSWSTSRPPGKPNGSSSAPEASCFPGPLPGGAKDDIEFEYLCINELNIHAS